MTHTSQTVRATAVVLIDGRREGSAVLVDRRYLLTADHVLRGANHAEVVLPAVALPAGQQARTRVRRVLATPGSRAVDAAVLDLGEDPPDWVPPPLTLSPKRRTPTRVRVFGFPRQDKLSGVWDDFEVSGPTVAGTVQLDWMRPVGTFRGHSGGPVLDRYSDMVAGVLVEGSTQGRFDRFVPAALIVDCWPQLPRPWLLSGPESVGHFHLRAYGQRSQARGGDLFRGREAALAKVRKQLTAPDAPGFPLVVTGQPGAGKSAVIARTVLNLQADKIGPGVAFHARGATHTDLLTAVADLTGADRADSTYDLVNSLKGQRDELWLVVLDALDEVSTTPERREITKLLTELAALPSLRVAVATRALTASLAESRYQLGGLLPDLGITSPDSPHLIDLDDDRYFERAGIRDYAAALLTQLGRDIPGSASSRYRADSDLCDRLASVIATQADRNYLVAAMAADRLATEADVVDPADPGFDPSTIPTSVRDAIDKHLDGMDRDHQLRVRGLLTALGYGRGTGIDDRLWLDFAAALGYTASLEDIDELHHSSASDFLIQATDTDEGGPVSRLFHQALADELLRRRHRPRDEQALLNVLRPECGWTQAGAYARHHAADHASACGRLPLLLCDPEFLAVADLVRLLSLLPQRPDLSLVPITAVLRQAAAPANQLPSSRRARLLCLVAAHSGLAELRDELATVCHNGTVPRWAHSLGTSHRVLAGHTSFIGAVAVGRLGGRDIIASGGDDGVRVWDAATIQPIGHPITGHMGWIRAVAVGQLGGRDIIIACAKGQDTVQVWDAAGGLIANPHIFISNPDPSEETDGVECAAIGRAGGRYIFAARAPYSGTLRVWDAVTGEPIGNPLTGHTAWIRAVAIGRAGNRDIIATVTWTDGLRVWDATTGQPIANPDSDDDALECVAIGRAGDRDIIASGGDDGMVRVWDAVTGEPVYPPLTGQAGRVWTVAIGRAGDRDIIASGGDDGMVRVWDAVTGEPIGHPLTAHTGRVRTIAIGHAGGSDIIAAIHEDPTVRIWDLAAPQPISNALTGHADNVHSLAVSRFGDRNIIASGGNDGMGIWDAVTGEPIAPPPTGHTSFIRSVRAVAIGRAGGRDIIASSVNSNSRVQVCDALTHQSIVSFPAYPGSGPMWSIASIAIGRAGGRDVIVSGGWHGVRVCDAVTGKPIANLHTDPIESVAIGRAGGRDIIASGSDDGMVRVWDAVTGEPIGHPLTAHTGRVRTIAIGHAGGSDIIASGGDDGMVRVWDAVTGEPIGHPLTAHTGRVRTVAIGQAGGRDIIASGGDDCAVRIWDAEGTEVNVADHLLPIRCVAMALDGSLYVAAGPSICAYTPPQ
ncbi:trypsin-like peptidase domain-containing protein [Streptomyces sp. NPDC001480]|uniref:trypsin-like peptidase domain-containing protein n=1 Tax=Streptomyces sp. NPDC001480 TaxID=3364577 RepID=UPI003696F832